MLDPSYAHELFRLAIVDPQPWPAVDPIPQPAEIIVTQCQQSPHSHLILLL